MSIWQKHYQNDKNLFNATVYKVVLHRGAILTYLGGKLWLPVGRKAHFNFAKTLTGKNINSEARDNVATTKIAIRRTTQASCEI